MRRTAAVGFVIAVAGVVWVGGLAGCHKDKDAESPAAVWQSKATDQTAQPTASSTPPPKAVRPSTAQSAESPAVVRQARTTDQTVQPTAPLTAKPRTIWGPWMGQPAEPLRPVFPWVVKREALWPLVARSEVIVAGTLDVRADKTRRPGVFTVPEYIELSVRADGVLKGCADGTTAMTYSVRLAPFRLPPETLMSTHGKQALAFLTQGDGSLAGKWYLADYGYGPAALQPASPELLEQVRKEVASQEEILRDFPRLFPPEEQPLYHQVKRLIDATTNKSTQAKAFSQLEELGFQAVPAIITLMDDRRDLGEHSISLRNRAPDAFEELSNYSPDTVVDALAAILDYVAGASFGDILSGGSEQQRQEAVNGWRIYLYYLRRGDSFRQTEMTPAIPRP